MSRVNEMPQPAAAMVPSAFSNRIRQSFISVRRSIAAHTPSMVAHLFFLVGLGAVAYGVWLIYRPAGFILAGLEMMWLAFLVSAEDNLR